MEFFHVPEVIGRQSLLVQEAHQIKNCLQSYCCLGYRFSAAAFKKSDAVPKMLISGKIGLKALAHKVQGALKPYAHNRFNMSICIVIAKDSSWHAGTLSRRKIF